MTQSQSRQESTVQYSETNHRIYRRSLFNKRMQSLITSGLVKGTIPMSMRKKSGQLTLDAVLSELDGENAEEPRNED